MGAGPVDGDHRLASESIDEAGCVGIGQFVCVAVSRRDHTVGDELVISGRKDILVVLGLACGPGEERTFIGHEFSAVPNLSYFFAVLFFFLDPV